jgi:restriction system protein
MIPDYQTLMRPVLECAKDGETTPKEAVRILAARFQLSAEELIEMLPSKRAPMFYNRVAWAKFYLQQAGLVESKKRGHFFITEEGRKALKSGEEINNQFLSKYTAFQDFKNRVKETSGKEEIIDNKIEVSNKTPDEILRNAHQSINDALALELLSSIRDCSPAFFEQLIVDLLLAMGYGGTSEDAGRALGKSGDNGIDGVIDQDPLGVDQIYIQAKRYKENNTVGSSDIRDFFGSLSLKKANKGIFVTTSTFTSAATQTAKDLSHRIVLIDGTQLTKLMIRYNIGCRDEDVLHIKKLDEDYFDEVA